MIKLFVFLLAQVSAQTVLMPTPEASHTDYRASLLAQPNLRSPSAAYRQARPLKLQRERLLSLFAEAQNAYLQQNTQSAQHAFKDLLSLLTEDDWQKSERRVFLHAYLRLAQLAMKSEQRDYWLTEALRLEPVPPPEDQLFPPPLLERWLQLRRELRRPPFPNHLWQAGWSEVLINGASCTRANCEGWVEQNGIVRLTVLSDIWVPQTIVTDVHTITDWQPAKEPWVTGVCGRPDFHSRAEAFPERQAFFDLQCLNLKPNPTFLSPPAAVTTFNAEIPKTKSGYEFLRSKWFWAGVGTVTAVLLVQSSREKDERQSSTTTYGY